MKQKFRSKGILLKGESSQNNLLLKISLSGKWAEQAKSYLGQYRTGDEISLKVEPWENAKTESVNNYFHVLLRIYVNSGLCSYQNIEELKIAVKMNLGCGVKRWWYLDNDNKCHIVKDEGDIPVSTEYYPIIKSWADYTLNESIACIDRLLAEMLELGISVDDIKLEYDARKNEITREVVLKREKEKAWGWFSKYIRTRECLQSTGSTEYGLCFTCGKRTNYEEMDAGHFIAGRKNAVLFDPAYVRGQCRECNRSKGGNVKIFREKLVILHGEESVQDAQNKRHNVVKYSESDYADISEEYRIAYNGLKHD